MKTYTLKETTLNAIVNYLGTCAYAQAAPLIRAIQEDIQLSQDPYPDGETKPVEEKPKEEGK